jgi:hypothetical protein
MVIIKKTKDIIVQSCTLLVGMEVSITIVENSIEIPQKIKLGLPYDPAIALLNEYTCPKGQEINVSKLELYSYTCCFVMNISQEMTTKKVSTNW